MSNKQKIAEMVLQKMKEKKELEERNRPHYQVLQLLVEMEIQQFHSLTQELKALKQTLQQETEFMETMEQHCLELQNTGKKPYPRIIVNPDFIASEQVKENVKEYYRKASNTFLREDILKRKKSQAYEILIDSMFQTSGEIKAREEEISKIAEKRRKTTNEKRVANLKQDLRQRSIRQEQSRIKQVIEQEVQSHKGLLAEYELKKGNLQNRMDWSSELTASIEDKKKVIQRVYNPVTYRNYLKTVFMIRTKNQMMEKNLCSAVHHVNTAKSTTNRYQVFLETHNDLFVQGKCRDSPSKKKRSSLSKSASASNIPKKKSLFFDENISGVGSSRFKTESLGKSRVEKSPSTSLRRTAASSMTNLLRQSGRQKVVSQSAEIARQLPMNQ